MPDNEKKKNDLCEECGKYPARYDHDGKGLCGNCEHKAIHAEIMIHVTPDDDDCDPDSR
jgi:uncharacterized Zn finger protein (UPF0148 family)